MTLAFSSLVVRHLTIDKPSGSSLSVVSLVEWLSTTGVKSVVKLVTMLAVDSVEGFTGRISAECW